MAKLFFMLTMLVKQFALFVLLQFVITSHAAPLFESSGQDLSQLSQASIPELDFNQVAYQRANDGKQPQIPQDQSPLEAEEGMQQVRERSPEQAAKAPVKKIQPGKHFASAKAKVRIRYADSDSGAGVADDGQVELDRVDGGSHMMSIMGIVLAIVLVLALIALAVHYKGGNEESLESFRMSDVEAMDRKRDRDGDHHQRKDRKRNGKADSDGNKKQQKPQQKKPQKKKDKLLLLSDLPQTSSTEEEEASKDDAATKSATSSSEGSLETSASPEGASLESTSMESRRTLQAKSSQSQPPKSLGEKNPAEGAVNHKQGVDSSKQVTAAGAENQKHQQHDQQQQGIVVMEKSEAININEEGVRIINSSHKSQTPPGKVVPVFAKKRQQEPSGLSASDNAAKSPPIEPEDEDSGGISGGGSADGYNSIQTNQVIAQNSHSHSPMIERVEDAKSLRMQLHSPKGPSQCHSPQSKPSLPPQQKKPHSTGSKGSENSMVLFVAKRKPTKPARQQQPLQSSGTGDGGGSARSILRVSRTTDTDSFLEASSLEDEFGYSKDEAASINGNSISSRVNDDPSSEANAQVLFTKGPINKKRARKDKKTTTVSSLKMVTFSKQLKVRHFTKS